MTNRKRNSEDTHVNPIDTVLNQTQEGEISRPESSNEVGFDVNADDLAHQPDSTSQEHSLDDTHETLTQARFDKNDLLEVAEDAMKENEEDLDGHGVCGAPMLHGAPVARPVAAIS